MKRQYLLIATSFMALAFLSCRIELRPQADFEFSGFGSGTGGDYIAGDDVNFFNMSMNAQSYEWTMPDGSISTDEEPVYLIPLNQPSGTLSFKLTAYSRSGKKSDEISKSIAVTAATGNAQFWYNSSSSFGVITVTMDGQTHQITAGSFSAPHCAMESECAWFTGMSLGTHTWTATNGSQNWSGSVTIVKGGCAIQQLN